VLTKQQHQKQFSYFDTANTIGALSLIQNVKYLRHISQYFESPASSVGIVTRLGLWWPRDRVSIARNGHRFFTRKRPNRLWSPTGLLQWV